MLVKEISFKNKITLKGDGNIKVLYLNLLGKQLKHI
jgi:hypothetical protein